MAEALEEIVVAKRQRYEDWRHRHLSTPFLTRVQRRLLRFLIASVVPAAGIAFAAHHNFDRAKMGDALKDGSSSLRRKVFGDKRGSKAAAAPAAPLEAAPAAPAAAAVGVHGSGKGGSSDAAAAALREAEAALRAAEAAQKAALDELQRSSNQPQQKKKSGWF